MTDDISTTESHRAASANAKAPGNELSARRPILICEDDDGIRELLIDAKSGRSHVVL